MRLREFDPQGHWCPVRDAIASFYDWLRDRGIGLVRHDPLSAIGEEPADLSDGRVQCLLDEYMREGDHG